MRRPPVGTGSRLLVAELVEQFERDRRCTLLAGQEWSAVAFSSRSLVTAGQRQSGERGHFPGGSVLRGVPGPAAS